MAISFKKVSHIYSPEMPFAYTALKDVDLSISEGKITAVIGETGSGKSTLIQHLNALLIPTSGEVEVDDFRIVANTKQKKLKSLRKKIGLVFQFSEYQLFEETVLKDVAFGPKNFGVSEEDAFTLARESLRKVGIEENLFMRSPLELSGGQKRRVAIAGILAMNPEVIVLDEPTAGLDPRGAREMLDLFKELNQQEKTTIILVCHDNELVYRYCNEVVVMDGGKVLYHGSAEKLFEDGEKRKQLHLVAPSVIRFKELLQAKGFHISHPHSMEELVKEVVKECGHE